jgi:hypothetical protein
VIQFRYKIWADLLIGHSDNKDKKISELTGNFINTRLTGPVIFS